MQSHHILEYPKTETLLWDHKSFGEALVLRLFAPEGPKLNIKEHILGNAARLLERNRKGQLDVFFTGSVSVCKGQGDSLCRNLRISLNNLCSDSLVKHNNDFCVPVTFIHKWRPKPNWGVTHYSENIDKLLLCCSSSQQIDISRFIRLNILCSMYGVRCDIHVELLTPSTTFRALQIPPITILASNMAVSLTANDSQENSVKTGFITMDKEKRLLLLSDCDINNLNYPLIGIWACGSPTIQHPVIYAACMRYVTCQSYKYRLCLPPQPFLIVHFGSQNDHPTFFDCFCTTFTSEGIIDFNLEEGDFTIPLAKVPILDTKLVNIGLKEKLGNMDFIKAKMKINFKNILPACAGLIITNSNEIPRILVQPTIIDLKAYEFNPQVPDISACSDSMDEEEICDSLAVTMANKSANRKILQCSNPITFHKNVKNTLPSHMKFTKQIQQFSQLPSQCGISVNPLNASSENVQSTAENLQSSSDIFPLPSMNLQQPSKKVQSQYTDESISQWINESSQILNKTNTRGNDVCFEEMDEKNLKSALEKLSLANRNNTALMNITPTESFEQCDVQEIHNVNATLSSLKCVHKKSPENNSVDMSKNAFSTGNEFQPSGNLFLSPSFSIPIYKDNDVDNFYRGGYSGGNESTTKSSTFAQKDHNLHSFTTQSNSAENYCPHVCQKYIINNKCCCETCAMKTSDFSVHDKQSLTTNQNNHGGLFKRANIPDSYITKCYKENDNGVKCSNTMTNYTPENLKYQTGELKNLEENDPDFEGLQNQISEMLAKQEEISTKMKELLEVASARKKLKIQVANPLVSENNTNVFKDNRSFEVKPSESCTSDPISKFCADISEAAKLNKVEVVFEPHTFSFLKQQRETLLQLQSQIEILLNKRNETNNAPKEYSTFSDERSNYMTDSANTEKHVINPYSPTSNQSEGSGHKNLRRSENQRVSIGTMTNFISDKRNQPSIRLSDKANYKNEDKRCSVGTMTSFIIENDGILDHTDDQSNVTVIQKSKGEKKPTRHLRNAEDKTNLKILNTPTSKTFKPHTFRHSISSEESGNEKEYAISSFSDKIVKSAYHAASSSQASSVSIGKDNFPILRDYAESSSGSFSNYSKQFEGKVDKVIKKQDHRSSLSPPSALQSISSEQRNSEGQKSEYSGSQVIKRMEKQPYNISTPLNTMTSENASSVYSDMSLIFQRLQDKYLNEEDYQESEQSSLVLPDFSFDSLEYLREHNLLPSTSSRSSRNEKNVKKHHLDKK